LGPIPAYRPPLQKQLSQNQFTQRQSANIATPGSGRQARSGHKFRRICDHIADGFLHFCERGKRWKRVFCKAMPFRRHCELEQTQFSQE
jgi:hypothetical protein